jgi:hypothetical protein
MAAKQPSPAPDGKSREQFVDRSTTEPSEANQSAHEQRGDRKHQWGLGKYGEPPGDHTDGQSDQQ